MKYRDLIKRVEKEGWRLVRTSGSHMIYEREAGGPIVTIPAGGKLSREVPPGTLNSILKQAGMKK